MICTAIVPDGDVIDVFPAVPYLEVMIFHQQSHEPIFQRFTLVWCDPIDVLEVMSYGIEGSPACDRIGPHHRVDGFELDADLDMGMVSQPGMNAT